MTAVQDLARALAAAVAYPSDQNRASAWTPPARTVPVTVLTAEPLWTLENTAATIGAEPDPELEGDWHPHAACLGADIDVFYPDKGDPLDDIVAICHDCPVRVHCLRDALNNGEQWGVWGGLSARQRTELRVGMRVANGLRPTHPARLRPINHGTASGADAHRRRGEPACPACREAVAAKNREYKRARRSAS